METKWLTIVRDIVSLGVGAFGLIHSQLTGTTSMELVVVYAALLGVPGVLNLLEMKGSTGRSKDSSSGSQRPPSSPS